MNMQKTTLLLLGSMLLFSCAKESLDPSHSNLGRGELDLRAGTVNINPSGDMTGNADADAIEIALNAAGSSTVILEAGTFYLNRSINIAPGFSGTLKGRGMNTTSLVGVGSEINPFGNTTFYAPLHPDPIQGSVFFYFPEPDGSLTISDMSLSIPNGFMAEQSELDFTQNLSAFISVKLGEEVADVNLKNLRLTGADPVPGSFDWYLSQPNHAAVVMGTGGTDFFQPVNSGGKIKMQGCHISRTSYQALIFEVLKDAKLQLNNNTISETKQINIRFLADCDIKVSNNHISTLLWGSVVVTQELALQPGYGLVNGGNNKVKITGNTIHTDGYLGVEIGGTPFPNSASFDVQIEGNSIISGVPPLPGIDNLGAIGLFEGLSGAQIRDNTLGGEAQYGIYFSDVDDSSISGNATDGFSAYCADYGLTGPSDGNNVATVIPANAVDEGTGNVFSGPVTVIAPCE